MGRSLSRVEGIQNSRSSHLPSLAYYGAATVMYKCVQYFNENETSRHTPYVLP